MAVNIKNKIVYPESDGRPIADNTKQFNWIMTIKGGLDILFKDDTNVFVAGDLLWYPVEGDPKTRIAPDAMVVFGRPKGDRGSYLQWQEGGITPQVVFEVLSPGNRAGEMTQKRLFYQRFGVEEYYIYDPDKVELEGWERQGDVLVKLDTMQGWVSPRLKVRFELDPSDLGRELKIYRPDGKPFLNVIDQEAQLTEAERFATQQLQRAEQERQRAEQERQEKELAQQLVEQERQRAEQERQEKELAQQLVEQERQQRELAERRLEELLAQLRANNAEPKE